MDEWMVEFMDIQTDSQWDVQMDKQKYSSYIEPHKTLTIHAARNQTSLIFTESSQSL